MGVSLDNLSPAARAAVLAQHPHLAAAAKPARSKYGARKTERDGVVFDSAKESRKVGQWQQLERLGKIADLVLQPEFPIVVTDKRTQQQVKVAVYRADAAWTVVDPAFAPPGHGVGDRVIADVKSEATAKNPVYRLKKKLVAALHGVDVVEF